MASEQENKKTKNKTQFVINSAFLTLTWVCLGLFLELNGPTFKDLQIKTGGSTEEIARAITGRSVGTFLGAVCGGIIAEVFGNYLNLMVGVALSTASVATAIAPWSPNPNVYWMISMFQGLCEGVTDIAGHRLILTMWLDKAASPLHALHLGFGIGSLTGPLLADPFLAVPDTRSLNTTNGSSLNQFVFNSGENITALNTDLHHENVLPKYIKESRIEIVYGIVAIFTACISVAFYFFQFCFHSKQTKSNTREKKEKLQLKKVVKEAVDPANCAGGRRFFGIQVFILLFFFFFNAIGDERMYGKFIRNFSIDHLKLGGSDASWLNSSYWICITIGRFIGFLVSRWIHIRHLIIIEVFGVLITGIFLNIFAYNNIVVLWVCTIFIGIFLAPLIPSGIAWGNYYVKMTGLAIMFTLQGGSVGSLVYMWVIGHIYERYGYRTFLYQAVAGGILLVLTTTIMTLIGRKHGGRFVENEVEIKVSNGAENNLNNNVENKDTTRL